MISSDDFALQRRNSRGGSVLKLSASALCFQCRPLASRLSLAMIIYTANLESSSGESFVRIFTLGIAVAVAATLAACDQKPKGNQTVTINGNGGNLTISGNGEHFTMKAGDGKSSVEINGAGMSANVSMPSFAPLYPGAKVTASMQAAGNDGKGGMVTFETQSGASDVIAFYKHTAAASEMTDKMDSSGGGSTMFAASDAAGKKSLEVVASEAGAGSRVQVTWSGN
jgi:hypothetical protein